MMESLLRFIETNIDKDPNLLRLKYYRKTLDFDINLAITQIEGRRKCKNKIPELLTNRYFLFPNLLLSEQCTNEIIAKFHASLVSESCKILDLTAGLCVDSFYMSKKSHVTAIEIDENAAKIGGLNMKHVNANVAVINSDCQDYINNCVEHFDSIFVDPARRDADTGAKVISFAQCSPNILELIPRLKQIAGELYIKASPMIDISHAIKEIGNVSDVWVVGLCGECKEILIRVDLQNKPDISNIHTIEFNSKGDTLYNFTMVHPCYTEVNYAENIVAGAYLYEPSSCIIKSECGNAIANEHKLLKLNPNSQIYISNQKLNTYPGRCFKILSISEYHSNLNKMIAKKYTKLNITARNFIMSASELKKQLKVDDGGDIYIFATRNLQNRPIIILCAKDNV